MTWFEGLSLLFGGGVLSLLGGVLIKVGQRNAKIDELTQTAKDQGEALNTVSQALQAHLVDSAKQTAEFAKAVAQAETTSAALKEHLDECSEKSKKIFDWLEQHQEDISYAKGLEAGRKEAKKAGRKEAKKAGRKEAKKAGRKEAKKTP